MILYTRIVPKTSKRQAQELLPFNSPSAKQNIDMRRKDVFEFLKELKDESVNLIVTDPAYSGMNQHLQLGKGRIVGDYKRKGDKGKWFEEFHDTVENYEHFLSEANRVLKTNSHIFLMFDSYSMLTLGPLVRKYFNVKNIIVWDKINLGMGHYFRRQSEFILFACKGKKPLSRRDISDIWKIKRIHNAAYPTQKPVELFEAMIASSRLKSDKEFLVCDPFMGSGSSAIASIKQGCSFIGTDISPEAFKLSRQRVKNFEKSGFDELQLQVSADASNQKLFWEK